MNYDYDGELILRARKAVENIQNSYNKEVLNVQQTLTFKVQNICSERRINGNTEITLTCIQDNITFSIEIKNSERENKELIRRKALETHNKCIEYEDKHKDDIREGSVI